MKKKNFFQQYVFIYAYSTDSKYGIVYTHSNAFRFIFEWKSVVFSIKNACNFNPTSLSYWVRKLTTTTTTKIHRLLLSYKHFRHKLILSLNSYTIMQSVFFTLNISLYFVLTVTAKLHFKNLNYIYQNIPTLWLILSLLTRKDFVLFFGKLLTLLKGIKNLKFVDRIFYLFSNLLHTHAHTHIYIYIYNKNSVCDAITQ